MSLAGQDDWSPSISADGKELYFMSWRGSSADIWVGHRAAPQGKFTPVVALDSTVNSPCMEDGPFISFDGLTLYFTTARDLAGTCSGSSQHVWAARRPSVEEPFAVAVPVPGLEQQTAYHPSLSPDELTIYFSSWSTGDSRIWVATRKSRSEPFSGLAVVDSLSSSGDDRSPSISADGLEIFFASNRSGGAGKLDLYLASRGDTSQAFSAPRRLAQLSTALDEIEPGISPDGRALYFNYDTDVLGQTTGHSADIWVAVRSCE